LSDTQFVKVTLTHGGRCQIATLIKGSGKKFLGELEGGKEDGKGGIGIKFGARRKGKRKFLTGTPAFGGGETPRQCTHRGNGGSQWKRKGGGRRGGFQHEGSFGGGAAPPHLGVIFLDLDLMR